MIDPATFATIVDAVAAGGTLDRALRDNGVAAGTFYRTLDNDSAMAEAYAGARAIRNDRMAEDILALSDSAPIDKEAINKARLQIDARKWLLSKLAPKKYGDALDLKHSGDVRVMIDAKDAEA